MTALHLALAYLTARWGTALIQFAVVLIGAGMVMLAVLGARAVDGLVARQIGPVDLVVGADGSPLQIALAGALHLDAPPGNVKLADAARLADLPAVRRAVPVSLGDSLDGWRILGASSDIYALYRATPAQGRLPDASMEAVAGAAAAEALGLTVGTTFAGSHGLDVGGEVHDDAPYTLVGVLAPTGTALDRTIITPLESVWDVHGAHDHAHGDERDHDHNGESHEPSGGEPGRDETTLILIQTRSPIAQVTLPRLIDPTPGLQSANPKLEIARLERLARPAVEGARALGLVLAGLALLGLAAALAAGLQARRADFALLRTLGASPVTLGAIGLIEAGVIGVGGAATGVGLAHLAAAGVIASLPPAEAAAFGGMTGGPAEVMIILGAGLAALLAAAPTALAAARADLDDALGRR
jgi:putative ABC transport system permease protein